MKKYLWLSYFFIAALLNAQPILHRTDIQIKQLATVSRLSVRIAQDPVSRNLYILENDGDIKRVNFGSDSATASFTTVYTEANHGLSAPLGMEFSQDGTLFLVGNETNQSNEQFGTGVIVKGIPDSPGSENRTWNIIASTVEYLYGFTYNHRMSGIAIDPNGQYIYVNSGARTDHGETREGFREVGLTSIILKLPIDSSNITLQDDREWLRTNGYLMAEGIRNIFDFAESGSGDIFWVENSGDRDDPEEMNWLQAGHHYGFPWNIGGNRTPQQDTPYVPQDDPLLSPDAWGGGNLYSTFYNDPTYPTPPTGVTFSEPVLNYGPDADKFRDTVTGDPNDASELGVSISTFTTHRSPNGIVFDADSILVEDLAGGAFVISLNASSLAQPLGDTGEDVVHAALTKNGDNYIAQITKLVSNLNTPLGIELVGNKLFVLETGLWGGNFSPKLWEITLPLKGTVGIEQNEIELNNFELYQNFPNPFNPTTNIKYSIPQSGFVSLNVFDVLGNRVATLVNEVKNEGIYEISFDATNLSSGVYFYSLTAGEFSSTKKLLLMK